ncbi:hypothetical protein T458_24420 [Brevibacillus panacihumi W25]|uniref:CAAX prenyl protease 2/Lysostaphin resistance protein A-like domain-containing protein n=1 Tax=Brevibacillus panacihumi W25 TaxID=1408254 RepID=V6M0G8_9BACL|nr:CPBP family intramembrane glutamic endopeptidase [Brevibacillus panacihumi]EST52166.1 hypothetical protein T458_24420 [Brevibacillus panacihumi W25]
MSKYQWISLVIIEAMLIMFVISFKTTEMYYLLIFTNLNYFINRHAHLIKNNWFKGADWVRRSVYFLPYLLCLLFLPTSHMNEIRQDGGLYLISIIIGICFIIPRLKELSPFYNKDFISLLPPVSFKTVTIELYTKIGSAVFQETYYKAFVLVLLYPFVGGTLGVFISSLLFMVEHFLHYWATKSFVIKDYLFQFLLSICGGIMYCVTGDIITAILVHLTYNLIVAFNYVYRFLIQRNKSVDC